MNEENSFLNETIKEKPFYRKKTIRVILATIGLAVLFGAVSCAVFVCLRPRMETGQVKARNIEIPEDAQETVSDQPEGTDDVREPIVIDTEIALADYELLFSKFRELAKESAKSLVTVTAVNSDVDWFDEAYENQGQSSGMIIGNNGVELLVLTAYTGVAGCDNMYVTFSDRTTADAVLKKYDKASGLAVVSVNLSDIPEKTGEGANKARLGNSLHLETGTPVLAISKADGSGASVKLGMITALHKSQSIVDAEYTVLVTDLVDAAASDGVLVNLNGEVVGILQNAHVPPDSKNVLTAYAISDMKSLIESLSNNRDVTYLGIRGVSVTDEAKKTGIPEGVYVTEVEMDSPAMRGGIQSGDVLQKINGQQIKQMKDLSKVLQRLSNKQDISLEGRRQTGDGYKKINYETTLSVLE